MSNDRRRRSLLQASGLAVAASLGGCLFGGGGNSGTESPGRQYDVVLDNRISAEDLDGAAYGIDASTKTRVEFTADRVRDGENELLFEKRVGLEADEERTFEDAFETETGGDPYAVNAVMSPLAGEDSAAGPKRIGFQFLPGEYNTPEDATLTVTTVDLREDNVLKTDIRMDGADDQ
jgi:hypothetical protein